MQKTDEEDFQNFVLRPVLKKLNPLLLLWLTTRPGFTRRWHQGLPFDQKKIVICDVLDNPDTKHQLLGMVLGQMDSEQLKHYLLNERSLRQRIYLLLKKRFLDQTEQLTI
jgi:hypothetical protein